MREVVLDTETTGLDPADGHRVIEIACVELDNSVPTGRHYRVLVHPERDIPEYIVPDGATKVVFNRVPTLDEVPYPVRMEPNLVVEFYSR